MKIYSVITSIESLCGCDGGPDSVETFESLKDARAKVRQIVDKHYLTDELNYKDFYTGPPENFEAAVKALQQCLPGSSEPFDWRRALPSEEYEYTEHWCDGHGYVFFGEPFEGCGSANVTFTVKALDVKPASKAKRQKTGAAEGEETALESPPKNKSKGKGKSQRKGEVKASTPGSKAKKAKASTAK